MRDWSRPLAFAALALLVLVLVTKGSAFTLSLGGLLRPALLVGLVLLLISKFGNGSCCGRSKSEASAE